MCGAIVAFVLGVVFVLGGFYELSQGYGLLGAGLTFSFGAFLLYMSYLGFQAAGRPMPANTCPHCGGQGRVGAVGPGGVAHGGVCPHCRGSGKRAR